MEGVLGVPVDAAFPLVRFALRSPPGEPSIHSVTICGNRHGPARRFMFASLAAGAWFFAACSSQGDGRSVVPPGRETATQAATVGATATAMPTVLATPRPASDALRAANELLREGRYEAAATSFGAIAEVATGAAQAEANIGLSLARFQDGDLAGAVAALIQAVAAAPPGSVEGVRAQYLLGVRLNEEGRAAEAAKVLGELMSRVSGVTLQPYIAAEYARALAVSGDRVGAGKTWDALLASGTLPGGLRAQVFKARTDAAREAGDVAELARWLDEWNSTDGESWTLYERAQIALAAGDEERFASLLRGVISNHSGSREALFAIVDLQAAGYTVDPGQEGLVYYRRGAYQEARRVLLKAVDEPGLAAETRAFRLYYLAAAYEDSGLAAEAVRYYDEAAGVGPSAYLHRARYWAARVTESRGRAVEAAQRYAALVGEGPAGEFSEEAAFRAGYALFEAGDAAGAVERWNSAGGAGGARAAYWAGRALESLDRRPEAETQYQRAADLGPLDFFGMQAVRALRGGEGVGVEYRKRDLRKGLDWAVIKAWLATRVPGAPSGVGPTPASELVAAGLRKEAAAVLFEAARGADAWRLLEIAEEAYRAGVVDVSAQLAVRIRQAAGVPSGAVPGDLLRVAYPVDYVAQLDEQARVNGLDPLFVAAVVRQESFWDAAAGSPAGALGLTQVIPPTGEGIALALGVKGFRASDLLKPGVSLRFGAYYLAGQVKRLGNPYYALSAYNAGPGNAVRWMEATGTGNAADFVEAIDYAETQHYVAVVMEHYAHYLQAYSE
ncbi:MAG: hypothetical protein C0506_01385 [Anaerolinea sp.]|nr:hypothetical protein [Anaerolinea sp.]